MIMHSRARKRRKKRVQTLRLGHVGGGAVRFFGRSTEKQPQDKKRYRRGDYQGVGNIIGNSLPLRLDLEEELNRRYRAAHLRSWFFTLVLMKTSPMAVSCFLNPPAVPAFITRSGLIACPARGEGRGEGGDGTREKGDTGGRRDKKQWESGDANPTSRLSVDNRLLSLSKRGGQDLRTQVSRFRPFRVVVWKKMKPKRAGCYNVTRSSCCLSWVRHRLTESTLLSCLNL